MSPRAVRTDAHLHRGTPVSSDQLGSEGPNGGDILVQVMRDAGVDVAFGVVSIHNLPPVQAVDRDLRFVPVRHEAAAINADLIGEDTGAYHGVPRQLTMLKAVSQHAMRVESVRRARATLTEAVRLLNTAPHGPVSVDWPIDLQYTADPGAQDQADDREPEVRSAPRQDVELAAQVMRGARRPLIWAGGGARRVGIPLTVLAEVWGAGVLTGANGRGSVPEDHSLVIGNVASVEAVASLVEEADCLLTIGSHLRPSETRNGDLPLPGAHVQIDLDEDVLGRNHPVRVGLVGDATVAVPALLLGECSTEAGWGARVAEAAASARKSLRDSIGAEAAICDSLRKRLPRRTPIVRDVTIPGSSWGNRLLAVYDPTDNVFAAGGGIGQGLAMAIGAAVGRPDVPVLALVGDGGLAVHLGELAVLAGEKPHVVLVVFNDGGYGVLRTMQSAAGDEPRAVDLATPDFGRLAEAFGLRHALVTDPQGFDDALAEALRQAGPSLIEVDVAALSPAPDAMVPPVQVPSQDVMP